MLLSPRHVLLNAILLVAASTSPVSAHAELVTAAPGPDDVVTELPTVLQARFSQNLDRSRGSIEVLNASGERVALGGPDPGRVRVMTADLPVLADGRFTVRWTSFSSEDQELARGTYTFTVRLANPSPSATASPSTSPAPTASASPSATASPSTATPATATPSATPSVPPTTATPTAEPSAAPGRETPQAEPSPLAVFAPIIVVLVFVGLIGLKVLRQRRT